MGPFGWLTDHWLPAAGTGALAAARLLLARRGRDRRPFFAARLWSGTLRTIACRWDRDLLMTALGIDPARTDAMERALAVIAEARIALARTLSPGAGDSSPGSTDASASAPRSPTRSPRRSNRATRSGSRRS